MLRHHCVRVSFLALGGETRTKTRKLDVSFLRTGNSQIDGKRCFVECGKKQFRITLHFDKALFQSNDNLSPMRWRANHNNMTHMFSYKKTEWKAVESGKLDHQAEGLRCDTSHKIM